MGPGELHRSQMIVFSVAACNQATKLLTNKICTTCRIWYPFQTTKDKSVCRKVVGNGAHISFTSLNKSSPDSTPKTSVGRWCLGSPNKSPQQAPQEPGSSHPQKPSLLSCNLLDRSYQVRAAIPSSHTSPATTALHQGQSHFTRTEVSACMKSVSVCGQTGTCSFGKHVSAPI